MPSAHPSEEIAAAGAVTARLVKLAESEWQSGANVNGSVGHTDMGGGPRFSGVWEWFWREKVAELVEVVVVTSFWGFSGGGWLSRERGENLQQDSLLLKLVKDRRSREIYPLMVDLSNRTESIKGENPHLIALIVRTPLLSLSLNGTGIELFMVRWHEVESLNRLTSMRIAAYSDYFISFSAASTAPITAKKATLVPLVVIAYKEISSARASTGGWKTLTGCDSWARVEEFNLKEMWKSPNGTYFSVPLHGACSMQHSNTLCSTRQSMQGLHATR
ncbi:hypothetical protein JOM56_015375 [Amanita muscaria]